MRKKYCRIGTAFNKESERHSLILNESLPLVLEVENKVLKLNPSSLKAGVAYPSSVTAALMCLSMELAPCWRLQIPGLILGSG